LLADLTGRRALAPTTRAGHAAPARSEFGAVVAARLCAGRRLTGARALDDLSWRADLVAVLDTAREHHETHHECDGKTSHPS
jgi:hypothetical protein